MFGCTSSGFHSIPEASGLCRALAALRRVTHFIISTKWICGLLIQVQNQIQTAS
jgi:hypothetical protein